MPQSLPIAKRKLFENIGQDTLPVEELAWLKPSFNHETGVFRHDGIPSSLTTPRWDWLGHVTPADPRVVRGRFDNRPARALTSLGGKRQLVAHWLFSWYLGKPIDFTNFRMVNLVLPRDMLDCNPFHWQMVPKARSLPTKREQAQQLAHIKTQEEQLAQGPQPLASFLNSLTQPIDSTALVLAAQSNLVSFSQQELTDLLLNRATHPNFIPETE